MWIEDVDGNLVNLSMTATISIERENYWDANDYRYSIRARTPTANMELSVVWAILFVGTEDECKAFLKKLSLKLSALKA